jgi:hypothetical protein
MPPSARQTAYVKTLHSLIELAEESIDDAEQLYHITFRTASYMAFSLSDSASEVRQLISKAVTEGFEDYQLMQQEQLGDVDGEDLDITPQDEI